MVQRVLCALLVAIFAGVALPRAAHADDVSSLDTIYFDVGYVQATDVAIFGDGPHMGLSGEGFRYYERHCCLARFLATITVGLALSAGAANNVKNVDVKKEDLGDGWERTTTTTTYYSEEEMRQKREAAAEATASILSFPFTMELIYFPQRDDGKLHGWQWSWYAVDWPRRSPLRFETGFHWDRLGGRIDDPAGSGVPVEVSYRSLGIPLKLTYRPVEWVQADVEWRWSIFYRGDVPEHHNRNQMVRGSLTVMLPFRFPLVDMVYGRATAQSNNVTDPGKVGFMLELGVRL